MNIRIILAIAVVALAGTVTKGHAQRVQIAICNPGCGPVIYGRPIYKRPVFVNPVGFCGPTQFVVVRPQRTVFLPSSPVLASGFPVLSPPSRLGAYRAPIVPVNNVRYENDVTWRRR
jgi:hypothetical protein